ncbi:MAG: hypothetical protein M3083_17640 [Actinomycetota bacterium]|nr:hypothetical protein [Actinomycetota bacterium]MDQ6948177.1 hypothetical protein [Actinomycetota bacterium]
MAGSLITFSVDGVFTLTQGQLATAGQLTIQGNGPAKTIIDGNKAGRVLFLDSTSAVTLSLVTVRTAENPTLWAARAEGS